MPGLGRLAPAAFALVVAGCGAGAPTSAPPAAPPPPPAGDEGERYEADGLVLQEGREAAMLCLGGVRLSLPPQCGDVPIEGWDWDAVDGEQTLGGTTWGEYHVVGRFDGRTFALAEAGPPGPPREEDVAGLEPACPEPEGGWPLPPGAALTQEDDGRAETYATAQPDYVSSWVVHLRRPIGEADVLDEAGPVVYNAVFTGRAAEHEAEIRARWEGPLCVVAQDVPTRRELVRIRRQAEASLGGLGLTMLLSDVDIDEHMVRIGVVADPGAAGQEALDARFGTNVVRLEPALRPVD